MTAGMNVKVDIWHVTNQTDNSAGGALITGSYTYHDLDARESEAKPNMLLLQQGYVVPQVYQFLLYKPVPIEERDEIEISWPTNHHLYGKRLRVIGVQHLGFHPSDPRDYLLLNCGRIDYANANQ